MIDSVEIYLRSVIGRRLETVFGAVFTLGAQRDNELLSVWFFFENLPLVRFFGDEAGCFLRVDETPPEPQHLGDAGAVIIEDITDRGTLRGCRGKKLLNATIITSPPQKNLVGVQFEFEEQHRPVVDHWGDELVISNELPDYLPQDWDVLRVQVGE